jgi:hypothetical protein
MVPTRADRTLGCHLSSPNAHGFLAIAVSETMARQAPMLRDQDRLKTMSGLRRALRTMPLSVPLAERLCGEPFFIGKSCQKSQRRTAQ